MAKGNQPTSITTTLQRHERTALCRANVSRPQRQGGIREPQITTSQACPVQPSGYILSDRPIDRSDTGTPAFLHNQQPNSPPQTQQRQGHKLQTAPEWSQCPRSGRSQHKGSPSSPAEATGPAFTEQPAASKRRTLPQPNRHPQPTGQPHPAL